MKCKIFRDRPDKVETEVNDWLTENTPSKILSTLQTESTAADDQGRPTHTITISLFYLAYGTGMSKNSLG